MQTCRALKNQVKLPSMAMFDGLKNGLPKVMEGKYDVGFSVIYQDFSRIGCVLRKFCFN